MPMPVGNLHGYDLSISTNALRCAVSPTLLPCYPCFSLEEESGERMAGDRKTAGEGNV